MHRYFYPWSWWVLWECIVEKNITVSPCVWMEMEIDCNEYEKHVYFYHIKHFKKCLDTHFITTYFLFYIFHHIYSNYSLLFSPGSLYGSQPTFVGLPVIKPGASGGLIGTFSLWLTLWHLHSKQPVSSSFLVIFIIRWLWVNRYLCVHSSNYSDNLLWVLQVNVQTAQFLVGF